MPGKSWEFLLRTNTTGYCQEPRNYQRVYGNFTISCSTWPAGGTGKAGGLFRQHESKNLAHPQWLMGVVGE